MVRGYEGAAEVEAVPYRPLWQLSDEEERRTKEVRVTFEPPRKVVPAAAPVAKPSEKIPQRPGPQPTRGMAQLLDAAAQTSRLGLLLLAALMGAAHAIQPGHGKTLVAAASLKHHAGRGVALGLIVTLTHVSSVLALAGVLALTGTTRYGAIHHLVLGGAGFLIAAVGCWRLGRTLGGHGGHAHPANSGQVSGHPRGVLGLGIAGGLVPCWDGVLLIVLAAALGHLALGVLLLVAFSAGMAAVLVAIGLLAARLRTLVTTEDRPGPWERRLALLSSLALTGVGLFMLAQS